jgi:hypothetical protein
MLELRISGNKDKISLMASCTTERLLLRVAVLHIEFKTVSADMLVDDRTTVMELTAQCRVS